MTKVKGGPILPPGGAWQGSPHGHEGISAWQRGPPAHHAMEPTLTLPVPRAPAALPRERVSSDPAPAAAPPLCSPLAMLWARRERREPADAALPSCRASVVVWHPASGLLPPWLPQTPALHWHRHAAQTTAPPAAARTCRRRRHRQSFTEAAFSSLHPSLFVLICTPSPRPRSHRPVPCLYADVTLA